MMLTIRALLLSPYGKNVAKPHYKPKGAQFAKHCMLYASESSFWPRCLVLCIRTTFCRSFVKILAEPNCGSKDGQFIKHWHTPLNQRFQLDLWYLPSERHFEALTVKLLLNAIKTKNIAAFQDSVTYLTTEIRQLCSDFPRPKLFLPLDRSSSLLKMAACCSRFVPATKCCCVKV